MVRTLPLIALLAACAPDTKDTAPVADTDEPVVDTDGDGVPDTTDCDPADPDTYPGAREIPYDGRDQDCDGEDIVDVDGDGFVGDSIGGDDCNDSNPDVHPGAEVVCYDLIDEDCIEGWSQYDCDSDGFELSDDCGDEDASVYPGAPDEWYDGIDSDCDTRDDYDQDEDGFRSSAHPDLEGAVGDDCDDVDPELQPDAVEDWDGIDNDCDAVVDYMTNRDATTDWHGDYTVGEVNFGSDIVPLGDLDGDGFSDLLVGVSGASEGLGRVYVLPHGEGIEVPAERALATIEGTSLLGAAVLALDGPSGPMVAISEPGALSVHLFETAQLTGGAALTAADAVGTITSAAYYVGNDLAAWTDETGVAHVFHGNYPTEAGGTFTAIHRVPNGVADDAAARWSWTGTGVIYDSDVVGDLDGDGLAEVAIATSGFEDIARVNVVLGQTIGEGTADEAAAGLTGFAGQALVVGMPDIDGDGYPELAISDWMADGAGSVAGKVWIVSGPDAVTSGAVDSRARATISGVADAGRLRIASGTGDVDGDGALDILACAPGDGESVMRGGCAWFGAAALAAGGDFTPGVASPAFAGLNFDDLFGADAIPHDVDNDGDDDLYVTAPGNPGAVYLFRHD